LKQPAGTQSQLLPIVRWHRNGR